MKEKTVIIFTKNGLSMRVKVSEFPVQKRRGIGVKAMVLQKGDEIVSVVSAEE